MTLVLAAISQRNVALIVVLILTFGWAIYLFSASRRTYTPGAELEVAPNRKPYYDDSVMEGPRLTRFLWWAFALMAVVAITLPLYWLREPFRQEGAGFDRGTQYFDEKAIERGHDLFSAVPEPGHEREPHFGCDTCHGKGGVGGVTNYAFDDPFNPDGPPKQVQWSCPPLNTVMLRFRPDEVKNIIVYGRANTPMPAWGVAGGGPMNEQQVDDIIAYLESITLPAEEVKAKAMADYGLDGKKIFDGECARCHTMGYSYGEPGVLGGGAFGPALNAGATFRQFPEIEEHLKWIADTALYGKAYGRRGVSEGVMPHFAEMLTPEQIVAVAEYERTLP
ncbi:MAG: c-type cytochrome [Acidimicrobiales bacterium]